MPSLATINMIVKQAEVSVFRKAPLEVSHR